MSDPVISAKNMPEMTDFLQRRRSCKAGHLAGPGPAPAQIEIILSTAARVPDHGKLVPWRFIVFSGEARREAGEILKQAWLSAEPDAAPAKLDLESGRFMRAPTVIAVVSSVKDGKTPEWEQILSAGAACFSLCLAANALGFSTVWLTEWFSYNETFRKAMGLNDRERFAGFIYIGTGTEPPQERDRPVMKDIVRYM